MGTVFFSSGVFHCNGQLEPLRMSILFEPTNTILLFIPVCLRRNFFCFYQPMDMTTDMHNMQDHTDHNMDNMTGHMNHMMDGEVIHHMHDHDMKGTTGHGHDHDHMNHDDMNHDDMDHHDMDHNKNDHKNMDHGGTSGGHHGGVVS